MSGLRTACVDVVETFANVAAGGRGDDRFVTKPLNTICALTATLANLLALTKPEHEL